MARMEVVQIQCDRCKRVETRLPQPAKVTPDFEMTLLGEKIVYQDLDEPCRETLKRLAEDIKEWNRELTQKLGPSVDSNEAPPLSVAPTYSPPQPHAAGAKR